MSASALSRQMQILEQTFGARFFVRRPLGVQLTEQTMGIPSAAIAQDAHCVRLAYSDGVTRVQKSLNATESKKAEARTMRLSRMSRNQA